jgi:hypothetical protein
MSRSIRNARNRSAYLVLLVIGFAIVRVLVVTKVTTGTASTLTHLGHELLKVHCEGRKGEERTGQLIGRRRRTFSVSDNLLPPAPPAPPAPPPIWLIRLAMSIPPIPGMPPPTERRVVSAKEHLNRRIRGVRPTSTTHSSHHTRRHSSHTSRGHAAGAAHTAEFGPVVTKASSQLRILPLFNKRQIRPLTRR